MHNQASISFILKVPFANIASADLLYPQEISGRGGMNFLADPGQESREYLQPDDPRRWPEKWVEEFDKRAHVLRTLLTVGVRNVPQNHFCVFWSAEAGLCQQREERAESRHRTYRGLAFMADGRIEPREVKFTNPHPFGPEVRRFVAAPPALWDDKIIYADDSGPDGAEGASTCDYADFTHIYKLLTSAKRGFDPIDVKAFRRLYLLAMEHSTSPASVANRAICAAAREMKLAREDDYVHLGVGCSRTDLVVVAATGRPEFVGALGRKAGAHAMIITENGGSVAIGRRPVGEEWRPLFSSWYFRKPTLAMAVFALSGDPLPPPPGLAGWGMLGSDFVAVHDVL